MSAVQTQARAARRASPRPDPSPAPAADVGLREHEPARTPGAFYRAGPALSLGAAAGGNGAGGGVQFKLVVGRPGDTYEREADAAADRVVGGGRAPAITPLGPGALARMAAGPGPVAEEEEPDGAVQPCADCEEKEEATRGTVEPPRVQRQAAEEEDEGDAHTEPGGVRPEGNAAHQLAFGLRRERGDAVHELHHEPQPEQVDRRDLDDHDRERDEREHPRLRIQHEVGAHDAGYRARRPDHRHERARRRGRLRQGCSGAAQQVEQQEAAVPHAVLDVVAEDPEVEHVAGEVHQTAVHEHRGDDGQPREGRRHQAERANEEVHLLGRQARLPQEDEGVGRDDRDGDDGPRA